MADLGTFYGLNTDVKESILRDCAVLKLLWNRNDLGREYGTEEVAIQITESFLRHFSGDRAWTSGL